jgi:hypothetical protein
MGIRYKAGGAMMTSAIKLSGREGGVGGFKKSLLACVGIKRGIIECFDQRPLCVAGRGIHFEVASDEKLASHGTVDGGEIDVGRTRRRGDAR